MLAIASGHRIVPIAHDAGEFWPRRGLLKRPGLIRVSIGPSIDPTGKDPRALTEEVKVSIESQLAKIEAIKRN